MNGPCGADRAMDRGPTPSADRATPSGSKALGRDACAMSPLRGLGVSLFAGRHGESVVVGWMPASSASQFEVPHCLLVGKDD